ncbi:MAG: hypothetical protein KDD53_08865 [Bdellovibrionales bacterium]|nr:hypothetical protein [Bdellovibrionales bacterium]
MSLANVLKLSGENRSWEATEKIQREALKNIFRLITFSTLEKEDRIAG